jgi:hypothetical protein
MKISLEVSSTNPRIICHGVAVGRASTGWRCFPLRGRPHATAYGAAMAAKAGLSREQIKSGKRWVWK